MYDFLTIHVLSLLKLEQTLKEFLNLEIDRAFIKLLQSLGFFFFFLTNEQKFETFFFSYKIVYFKSSAIDIALSQQNLGGKLLKVGKR